MIMLLDGAVIAAKLRKFEMTIDLVDGCNDVSREREIPSSDSITHEIKWGSMATVSIVLKS